MAEYNEFDNLSNKLVIHGFLRAIQTYVLQLGLLSTAAHVISVSGICKEDLIECQLETNFMNELMLEIINQAYDK